jgi:hypothetical protein
MKDFEKYDIEYKRVKARDSSLTFAEFATQRVLENIKTGLPHATLGNNLKKHKDIWEAGKRDFDKFVKIYAIKPEDRVVDYGCGSLRVGCHLINYLMPGGYFGLDVHTGFIEYGKEAIDPALLDGKKPQFGAISPETVASAAAFGARIVFSSAVSHHVHPDDVEAYFGNLVKIAHRPDVVLFFETAVAEEPLRYKVRSWARSLEFFDRMLPGLARKELRRSAERVFVDEGQAERKFLLATLEYRRS